MRWLGFGGVGVGECVLGLRIVEGAIYEGREGRQYGDRQGGF